MSVAFLFPGQGAQRPGMLHDLPLHDAVKATLAEAADVLQRDVLLLDAAERLDSTVDVQLSLLIAAVATARALVAGAGRPAFVAGLSVGTFAAAVTARALGFEDALRLVRSRATLMERSFDAGYGLGAIVGLREADVVRLVATIHDARTPLYIANINAPRQIVVAGARAAIATLLARALRAGASKAQALGVAVPSHCPLLEGVAERLTVELRNVALHRPQLGYIGNRRCRMLRTADDVAEELATNVAHQIRWHDATVLAREYGADLFVEMPPGHVLCDLAAVAFPDARAIASDGAFGSASTLIERALATLP
ncbi:MAG: malonate decarboxylase subunit epsilon [Candidatus Eremiobacteraeota bacterium]|nr:malonate decarboxylase subunit epsilon [Candidatus Eremiobacteraeota bacterium]